jgi:hypothetical protein
MKRMSERASISPPQHDSLTYHLMNAKLSPVTAWGERVDANARSPLRRPASGSFNILPASSAFDPSVPLANRRHNVSAELLPLEIPVLQSPA